MTPHWTASRRRMLYDTTDTMEIRAERAPRRATATVDEPWTLISLISMAADAGVPVAARIAAIAALGRLDDPGAYCALVAMAGSERCPSRVLAACGRAL